MKKNKTRERIIEVSVQLFNDRGTSNVTTNHIAEHLGISPGNLYYHFRNKEEIIYAVFLEVEAITKSLWVLSGDNQLSFNDIQRYVETGFTVLWKYRFFFRELPQLFRKDPGLEERYHALQKQFVTELEQLLVGLSQAGIIKPWVSKEQRQALVTNIWILGNFWNAYLESMRESLVPRTFRQGLDQIYYLLEPYVIEEVRETVYRIVTLVAAKLVARTPEFAESIK